MKFNQWVSALALIAASSAAVAATSPAALPVAGAEINLAAGAPASVIQEQPWYGRLAYDLVPYSVLSDGDRVTPGPNVVWTAQSDFRPQYQVDLLRHRCQAEVCPDSTVSDWKDVNKVVVYSRQDAGSAQEPTDSTTFTQSGAVDFKIQGLVVEFVDGMWWYGDTIDLAEVKGNNLVKRTVEFTTPELKSVWGFANTPNPNPNVKIGKLEVIVTKQAGDKGPTPDLQQAETSIVEIEAFQR